MKCRHVWRKTWTRSWPASHSPMTCSSGVEKFKRRTIDKDPKIWGIFSITWCLGGGGGREEKVCSHRYNFESIWCTTTFYRKWQYTAWLVDGQMFHGTISALNKVNQGEYQTSAWNSVRMFGESRRCSPISSESSATQQTNHRLIDLFCWNHITRAFDDCNRIDPIGVILARLQLHAEGRTLSEKMQLLVTSGGRYPFHSFHFIENVYVIKSCFLPPLYWMIRQIQCLNV